MKNLLINRKYDSLDYPALRQNWYAPSEILQGFKSVVTVNLTDTTNSGGNWGGYFVQKIGKRSYVIQFSQDSNYPRTGYTIYTGNVALSFVGELGEREICEYLYE